MSIAPGTRLGPYEILSALGRGGMGQVYRACDTRLQRVVAIKVLAQEALSTAGQRARLGREARAIAALSHPHICALHDFDSENGIDYLVMEYLEGETLAECLLTGPPPVADVLRYVIEIASALEHAHRRGFVHGDFKPANVMVTKAGAVLLDFGLARPLAGAAFVDPTMTARSRAETRTSPSICVSRERSLTWLPSSWRDAKPTRAPTFSPSARSSTKW